MLQGNALRHQMVLPEQQSIYDYWRSRCKNGRLPSREDIWPEDIAAHLPTISILEIEHTQQTPRFRVRLAGTGFWNLYDREIQGEYIDQLPLGDRSDYWQRVLSRVVSQRRPTAGVTRPGTPIGGHLAQYWIRMPLSSDGQTVDAILGYDYLKKRSEAPEVVSPPVQIYA